MGDRMALPERGNGHNGPRRRRALGDGKHGVVFIVRDVPVYFLIDTLAIAGRDDQLHLPPRQEGPAQARSAPCWPRGE